MPIVTFEKITNIIILSFVIGIILTVCLLLRGRAAVNFENITRGSLKSTQLGKKYIILFALLFFPAIVYLINNLNDSTLLYFYFFVGFLTFGAAGYLLTKNITAVFLGVIYPVLYFNYWNIYTFNLIAILFVISIILLMSNLITWNILKLLFMLILILDITLVFITKDMVHAGSKLLSLQIPILIHIPIGGGIILGLGDIFMIGLLCLQFTKEKRYPDNKSLEFIWVTTALFFIMLYILTEYFPKQTYPATLFVAFSFAGAAILFRFLNVFVLIDS